MTLGRLKILICLALLLSSCSLALDTDVLQEGDAADTDTGIDTSECTDDADCRDTFDCTVDECDVNQKCVRAVDHSLCDDFEICTLDAGCTASGKNCERKSDCDDDIDCTVDMCSDGKCINSPAHSMCENSVAFCREDARCVPEAGGCVEGAVIKCDPPDNGVCVTAACNERNGLCETLLSPGADKDSDSALDALCGGDDCNDSDAAIFPNAVEYCDTIDNNCDGTIDALYDEDDVVPVAQGATISNAQVAINGTDVCVIWESNGLQAAVVQSDGSVLGLDFTTVATGVASQSAVAASPSEAGVFFVAFTLTADGGAVTLQVARLEINDTGDGLTGTVESTLDSQLTTEITHLTAGVDHLRTSPGWWVAWSENDDTTGYVRFQSHDMTTAATIASGPGEVADVSVAMVAAESYVAAFAATFETPASDTTDGNTDQNFEIFLSTVQNDGGFAATGAPQLISEADSNNQGDDDDDPSVMPGVAADRSTGAQMVIYRDHTGLGNLKTLVLWNSETSAIADILETATLDDIPAVDIAHDGEKAVALYIRQSSTISRIIFDQLVPTSVLADGYERLARLELTAVSYPETILEGAAISEDVSGNIAVIWIAEDATGATLQLAKPATCTRQQ